MGVSHPKTAGLLLGLPDGLSGRAAGCSPYADDFRKKK